MNHTINIYGEFDLRCLERDGTLAWRRKLRNGITNAGLDYLGGTAFCNGAGAFPQITTWYAGAIDLTGFNALAAGDTMASHSGWRECTLYSGARPTWVNTEGTQQVSSNGPFTFPVTGNGTVHGMFITSGSVVGGNQGVLWCTALLPVDAVISTGQNLTGTYKVTFAGG